MDSDLALGVITIVGFLLIFAAVMFPANKRGKLKQVILLQDNTIAALRKELSELQNLYHNKQLEITRVAADNAVLKQRVIVLEDKYLNAAEKAVQRFKETGMLPISKDVEYVTGETGISVKEKKLALPKDFIENKDLSNPLASKSPNWATSFQIVNDEKLEKPPIKENIPPSHIVNYTLPSDDIIDNIRKNITKKKGNPKSKMDLRAITARMEDGKVVDIEPLIKSKKKPTKIKEDEGDKLLKKYKKKSGFFKSDAMEMSLGKLPIEDQKKYLIGLEINNKPTKKKKSAKKLQGKGNINKKG